MKITTFPTNMQKLPNTPDTVLMLRVGMAVNDIASGDFLLHAAKNSDDPRLSDLNTGIALYAIRLMVSHMREALWIVEDIRKAERDSASYVGNLIPALPPKFQEQYALLQRSLPNGVDHTEFMRRLKAIRDVITFHYGREQTGSAIKQALADMAGSMRRPVHKIVVGDNVRTSRIALVDAVVDRVACRLLLGADPATVENPQIAVDDEIAWCMERTHAFHDFGFALCMAYFGQYGAA